MAEPLSEHSEETKSGGSPRILLYSAVLLVAVGLAVFLWYNSGQKQNTAATAHLPFGPAEQAYAAAIRVEGIALERAENYLHQEVTTIKGSLINSGDRTLLRVELSLEFQDDMRQVVLRHSFISTETQPLGPRALR